MQVDTVKVEHKKNKRGFKTINKSDFDNKIHKAYKPKAAEATQTAGN